jgi:DNA invertase Pin-like site-specific DNA recombinase
VTDTKSFTFQNRVTDPNGPCSETGGLSNAPKSVGYARVSTQHQNLEQQLAALKSAGCGEVYGEKVSSTVPAERREALQKALGALEPSDTLVVAKLDRLGRTQSEVVARLATLQSEGKYVRTLDGLLNTAGLGKLAPLVVGLLTGLAEVERNLVQERTRESVEHRRRTGGNVGGRPALCSERAALVARLRCEGLTYRQVAEAAGVSVPTAYRYGRDKSTGVASVTA